MIHWLIESTQDMQDNPEWFLSKTELEKYFAFHHARRRSEWLLGRWTAKRLVQAALLETDPHIVALDALEIRNDADGVPYLTLSVERSTLNLSISHSHEHAVCAVSQNLKGLQNFWGLGIDLEFIEPRAENFIHDYFTPNEIARVNASSFAQRDILANALWSAKEAALKALRKGLSVDTRAVEIFIPEFDCAPELWARFEIKTNLSADAFNGWWRVWDGFVITLATTIGGAPDMEPLYPETILVTRQAVTLTSGAIHDSRYGIVHRRIAQATRHHARHAARN